MFLSEVHPATATHPKTGEKVWFNQANGFHLSAAGAEASSAHEPRLNAFFVNGDPIAVADLDPIRAVIRAEMVLFQWQVGDLLVLDNMPECHGRMPFCGPREVVLAMA